MNLNKMIMLSALALSLTGCMTVEGMRAKLNSGDPKLVAEAEETIIRKAARWNSQSATSKEVVIECLALIENNQALYGLIDSGYGNLLVDAAKSIKIRNENDAKQTIRKCIEWADKNKDEDALAERAIAKIQSPSVLHTLYGEAKMLTWPKGAYLAQVMANRLCEIETNQLALANLICKSAADHSYKEQAFTRITELPAKLKLLEEYAYHKRIINSLSENEIADYVIGAVDKETYEKEKEEALSKISLEPTKGDMKDSKIKAAAAAESVQLKSYTLPDYFDIYKLRVNDQKLLGKIVLKAKLNNIKQVAAEKITDKKIKLVLIRRFIKDWSSEGDCGRYESDISRLLVTLATEQDGLYELVSHLDKSKSFLSHKTIVERITDFKVADMMFDKMSLSIYKEMELLSVEGTHHSSKTFEIIEKLFSKMSKEKKASLLKGALERSKSVAHRVNFEGFYVGMPLIDFYLLREHYGISIGYEGYKFGKENVWHNNLFVTDLQFSLHACQKFLDCEDSKILYQTIHKYVMHKEGKANILDYMGLIKHETEDASTSSFDIWTGTTSTDYDFKNWETYSNSKLNTKIWLSVKEGILRFTGV